MNPLPALVEQFHSYQGRFNSSINNFVAFKKNLFREDVAKFELSTFMVEPPQQAEANSPIFINAFGRQYKISLGMRVTNNSSKGILIFTREINGESIEVETVTFNGQGILDFKVNGNDDDEFEMGNWHHAFILVFSIINKELNSTLA